MRALNGTRVKDMVSTSALLTKFGMLSVNQLNAQVKVMEVWKAMNVVNYPLKINHQSYEVNRTNTRADVKEKPIEFGMSNLVQKSCVSDAIRLWNMAPSAITSSSSLSQARKEIKKFVKLLPI